MSRAQSARPFPRRLRFRPLASNFEFRPSNFGFHPPFPPSNPLTSPRFNDLLAECHACHGLSRPLSRLSATKSPVKQCLSRRHGLLPRYATPPAPWSSSSSFSCSSSPTLLPSLVPPSIVFHPGPTGFSIPVPFGSFWFLLVPRAASPAL